METLFLRLWFELQLDIHGDCGFPAYAFSVLAATMWRCGSLSTCAFR